MLSELDETIRQILIKEGGFDTGEVDVSFEIPNREWSAGISKPTLNCYLFDIHEKRTFREAGWQLEGRGSNGAARRQPPLFFEMTYLITAWTRVVEDEHRLLWHVLHTMVRFPTLPAKHLQGALRDYGEPIHTTIAQMEGVLKSPGEFWTALENHLKPSLSLALDREAEPAGPPVLSTRLRIGPSGDGKGAKRRSRKAGQTGAEATTSPTQIVVEERDLRVTAAAEGRFHVAGVVRSDDGTPVRQTTVEVAGHNLRTTTDSEGHFHLDGLLPGRYTLVIHEPDRVQRRTIMVRDPEFKLTLDVGDAPMYGGRPPRQDEGGDTTS